MCLKYPYGFIYETICIPNGRRYIGSHRRYQNPEDPDDSWYIGSSTNPDFWNDLEEYGIENFKRIILENVEVEDREYLQYIESLHLKSRNARDDPMYYNMTVSTCYGGGSNEGKKLMYKGDECHYFDIDDISKMESLGWVLGNTEKNKLSNSSGQMGKVMTVETKRKISDTLKLHNPMFIEGNRDKVAKSKLGKVWVHIGDTQTYIEEDEVNDYLSRGYSLGMVKRSGVKNVDKNFERICGICGSTYIGGKYSVRCPTCYSKIRSEIRRKYV